MKIEWEAADIKPGRIVGKPGRGERWMIGYDATVATDRDGPRWCLVSLSDGMVQSRHTKEMLAKKLTLSGELPVETYAAYDLQNVASEVTK